MNMIKPGFSATRALSLTLLLLAFGTTQAGDDQCQASGDFNFICGPKSAEDLVLVPGTQWIIASGMEPGAAVTLIDTEQKSWSELYPADRPRAEQNIELYEACPGSPDPNNLVTHGLNIRAGESGHSTLYVVGHGEREAIEVFDVDASGARPELTWTGCVMMPEGLVANSVASFSDGSLVVTVPLRPDNTIADAFAGELTGSVYQWSPGDEGFEEIAGTELPYGNGIEVSADDQEIYVASSGGMSVIAYSASNPARQLRVSEPLAFLPDNLHMGRDGRLITAGMVVEDPHCGNIDGTEEFDLAKIAACPRPFIARSIDPQTMEGGDLVNNPAIDTFSNITMAVRAGDNLWLGTFAGDRIGYISLKSSN